MVQRLKIVVMLGGPSAEREVSLRSGAGVAKALRSLGHTVIELDPRTPDWILPPETDVVFLALHGTYGEDGTVQAQLEKLGVPYTGCDAEASRIAFDKVLTKQRCIEAGVPTAKFLVVESAKTPWPMGWQPPLVVKPVRQGSSVGLQFVERVADWRTRIARGVPIRFASVGGRKNCRTRDDGGHFGRQSVAGGRSPPESRGLRLSRINTRRAHGIFLPGGF